MTEVAPRSATGVAILIGSPVQTSRHTSAIMKESPRVTSTCASSAPTRRRKIRRSTMPPSAATRSPPRIAAVQKSKPCAIKLVARYAPSMKNEPCVRLGIFMSPKISENPADRRNKSPPRVMLLTARTTHKFMIVRYERRLYRRNRCPGGGREGVAEAPSRFERRIVPRVDRLSQEPLLVVGPELADFRIGLDRRVDELVALPLGPPDVEGPDHVTEVIERERPSGRVDQRDAAQRPVERLAVVRLAACLFQRRLRDHAVDVEARGIEAGNVAVVLHHPVDEPLVARRVEIARVGGDGDHADGLVAIAFEKRLVAGGSAAEHGQLEALVLVLLHELQRIRAREPLHDRVD